MFTGFVREDPGLPLVQRRKFMRGEVRQFVQVHTANNVGVQMKTGTPTLRWHLPPGVYRFRGLSRGGC